MIGSAQGPALGSAIHAAVAAGATRTCARPPRRWAGWTRDVYRPDEARAEAYDALYAEYRALHDYFGRGGNDVLLRLRRHPQRGARRERERMHRSWR